jgi:hypothetical protein
MSDKFEFGSWPLDEADDDAMEAITMEAVEQALQDMAREGLIVDSGRREWSELTGRYEIVWVAGESAHQQKKLN